jgi:hypothetical protein
MFDLVFVIRSRHCLLGQTPVEALPTQVYLCSIFTSHYADDHPLYTYAVYSPRTRKVLMRQDCIFLPKLFPMRIARVNAGMAPGGETLNPIRSPTGRQCTNPEVSFANRTPEDPLPSYDDHVRGWKLKRPKDFELTGVSGIYESTDGTLPSGEPYFPSNPAFGASSVISVNPIQALGGTASDETPAVDDAFARQTSITMGPRGTGFPIWLVYQGYEPGTTFAPSIFFDVGDISLQSYRISDSAL